MMLLHALHLLVPASLFFFNAPWLASIGLFLGAFALFHDTVHANLGLPRRINEATLALTGMLLGVSGLAARRAHLFHHAHPGALDDMEGRDMNSPLWLAIVRAPVSWLALFSSHWRKPRVAFEWALVALFCAVAPREYVIVMIVAQGTMSLWAGRWSHRQPRWLLAAALPLARFGISLATLFVTHEAHHEHPWKATFELSVYEKSFPIPRISLSIPPRAIKTFHGPGVGQHVKVPPESSRIPNCS